MCNEYLLAHMHVHCMCAWRPGRPERALELLELESQRAVSSHGVWGTEPGSTRV